MEGKENRLSYEYPFSFSSSIIYDKDTRLDTPLTPLTTSTHTALKSTGYEMGHPAGNFWIAWE